MQLNVLNDLAKAKRRWTEKKLLDSKLLDFCGAVSAEIRVLSGQIVSNDVSDP